MSNCEHNSINKIPTSNICSNLETKNDLYFDSRIDKSVSNMLKSMSNSLINWNDFMIFMTFITWTMQVMFNFIISNYNNYFMAIFIPLYLVSTYVKLELKSVLNFINEDKKELYKEFTNNDEEEFINGNLILMIKRTIDIGMFTNVILFGCSLYILHTTTIGDETLRVFLTYLTINSLLKVIKKAIDNFPYIILIQNKKDYYKKNI